MTPPDLPTITDLRAAAERLKEVAVKTPLLESELLNRAAGRRVLVKAECLQRTGSFKFRGAWSNLSAQSASTLSKGVVAFSSGNHAQGVACAAAMWGVAATIVMPVDAPTLKRMNTEAYGADVITFERGGRRSREEIGAELQAGGRHLVKPFDDALVIAGQGSTGLEIAAQARAAGVEQGDVLVCCGGGGLASGISLALEAEAPRLRVRPVEPRGFDDWARSLETGARQSNDRLAGSICDAILAPTPGELTFAIGRERFGPGVVVSDEDARRAMAVAFRHLKIILEPGGAVGLAAALFAPEIASEAPVIVLASGGNVDLERFLEWTHFARWSADGLPFPEGHIC